MTEERAADWLFTFGYDHAHPNRFIRIRGTFEGARSAMIKRYGTAWCAQEPASEEAALLAHGITEWVPVVF